MGQSPFKLGSKWATAICGVAGLHILLSLLAPRGFALTALGDLAQTGLLLLATVATLSNINEGRKKERLFWALLGFGFFMWLCAQVMWTYFEVFLRQEAPNPFVGDVILFLHIVPIMAAVALQPHLRQDDRTARVSSLDFLLLLTWWLYLYLFVVIPWQYVHPAESEYGASFDALYACEQLVLVFALILVWRRSEGAWRSIYAQLCGAALLYCTGSIAASEAIDFHKYYTGSLYDVPLITAMTWFAGIGFSMRKSSPPEVTQAPGQSHGLWKARMAMIVVFVTPLMVAWAQFAGQAPQAVRTFRLLLTVAVMILMGMLVFFKQHLLDQELLGFLQLSRENLDEMRQLKDELENKEQSLRWHSLELQRKNLELQEISFTDALTGLWNRRYLEEIVTAEAGQVLRNYQRARGADIRKIDHRDLVFLMVDVDFFKEVNDRHGHPAGDRLLVMVAQRLAGVVRKSDVLVRWGGEEFLIMTRSADPTGTPAFCSRILETIAAEPFDLGHNVFVRKTCSVGWAPYPWRRGAYEALCAEEVLELADAALYRAKSLGRNQGVGILPAESCAATSAEINLTALRACDPLFTRIIRTECPLLSDSSKVTALVPEPADQSG